jgi:hypothetical protein
MANPMEDIKGYDEWKTKLPKERIIGYCEQCGGEIYSEPHWKTVDGRVHEECFDEFAQLALEAEMVDGVEA